MVVVPVALLGLWACRPAARPIEPSKPALASYPHPLAEPAEPMPVLPRASERHRDQVERLVAPLLARDFTRSLVIGLLHAESEVYGFGQEHLGKARAPDGDTLYEIGSISKVLTALLLAREVEEGTLRPDDPVSKLLPAKVRVPERGGRAITLIDLATHSSGLPRTPANMRPKDPDNPYADYDVELLYEFLASHELEVTPGTRYAYSHVGMGLLGHALSRHRKQSYEQMVVDRIAAPLGMTRTRVTLGPELAGRLADAHDDEGNPVPHFRLDVLAGAGALRSTTFDLLRFAQSNLAPSGTSLGYAIRRSREQKFSEGGEHVAYGWDIEENGYWHNGQTGGHCAFLIFDPQPALAVVILAGGEATSTLTKLGNQLMHMLRGETPAPLDLPKLVHVAAEDLERLVGTYALDDRTDVRIFSEEDRLYAEATGQPRLRLFSESATVFHLRAIEASVTFELEGGRATSFVTQQKGVRRRARRK